MATRKRSRSNDSDVSALYKQWDEASCPICMDHPHNAVLLICSSYEKGCRSYICDTSHRHSNCLDRFKNSKKKMQIARLHLVRYQKVALQHMWLCLEDLEQEAAWELRRHARRVHPTVRPADVDPSRQRAWRRLEHRTEYNDIVSAVRSAMPGAIVLGDYVIENGDRVSVERDRGEGRRWLSTLFYLQMISMDSGSELRAAGREVYRDIAALIGPRRDGDIYWHEPTSQVSFPVKDNLTSI
ncbi:hypothetical protein DH2020_024693 [Rehmannia glutinosa]|uniref:DUF1644 domain-containing protein n=1 Tax=Rehmannia glutinosa TaxID=99300 RepID=A0ABR0W1Q0_REHGL